MRRRQGKANDEAGIRAVVELQANFKTTQALIENVKEIYTVTKCTNAYYIYNQTDTRGAQ